MKIEIKNCNNIDHGNIEIEELDIAFVGNARVRPAGEELRVIIDQYNWKFKYYGHNIQGYRRHPKAKDSY